MTKYVKDDPTKKWAKDMKKTSQKKKYKQRDIWEHVQPFS